MNDFRELRRRALERHLREEIAGEVRFDSASRKLYSTDASIYLIEPLGVVIPRTVEDVRTTIQIAGEHAVPVVPRGGGTSLSGQSIGPGVVIDCSKYLRQILEIDAEGRRVRVQPGVVLDQLNRALEPHGLQFGPDVSTANRANLGGMIGNNSAGSRSIVHGMTSHHLRRLEVVLADGSRAEFGPITGRDWSAKALGSGLESEIYRSVQRIVLEQRAEILRRFPKILRRVSGYDLLAMLQQFDDAEAVLPSPLRFGAGGGVASLAPLIAGSEGTLAFAVEAELSVVPRPRVRGLLAPHFDSLPAAMAALPACMELKPSAVELMDQRILDLARENLSLRHQMAAIRGRPATLFMVEFSGDDPREVEDRLDRLQARLDGVSGVTHVVKAMDPALRDSLWNLRLAGLPLLLGVPGDRKPITFVEDAAVAPEHLPEYVARFREVLRRHGTDGAFYGHASVGCLHIRPILNLKDSDDVARMRRIAEEVTDLVLEYGGSLSGEHGDGLARSEWNRKMFGDTLYEAFRQVKRAFDPQNRFNPGKIVDAPAMDENLRTGPDYRPHEPPTVFDYSRQEGFARSIEMCNGSGACRKIQGGTMCPSYRATLDEADTTRGRANALRLAIASEAPLKELRSDWVYRILDLCLMCKACKAECPSNVDLAKLKAEFLHQYYQINKRPASDWAMAAYHRLVPLAAPLGPLVNWLGRNRFFRWAIDHFAGFDRRRSLPPIHRRHFRRWFTRHRAMMRRRGIAVPEGLTRVLLLDDCFTTFQEPNIGRSAVILLERSGCQVELLSRIRPRVGFCCGRTLISKGFLTQARELVRRQSAWLADEVESGAVILGVEPSCLLTLADEWPELFPDATTRRIAAAVHLAEGWLGERIGANGIGLEFERIEGECLVHGHCHQKALVGVNDTIEALRRVPDLRVRALDVGCCGMAGSFGYEAAHYDLSVAIANLALVPQLKAAPEAVVVATGTSCRHQIRDLTGRTALHPLELLAERLTG